jgi:hypothetical protein
MLLIPYAQHAFDFMFGGLSEQIVEKVLLKFLEDRPKTAAATAPAEATPDADSLPEKRARPLDEGAGKDPQ